jgi:hypothetical protein
MPVIPPVVALQEELGRAVFDSRKVDRAKKGTIVPTIFQERLGVRELSVDRLGYIDLKDAANLQTELRSEAEGQPRHCKGWAVVTAADASQKGRVAVSDPILPRQPHHANIVLPAFAEDEAFNVQKEHAVDLAARAAWRDAPSY